MVVSWPPQAASVTFPPSIAMRWPQPISIDVPVFPAAVPLETGGYILDQEGNYITDQAGNRIPWSH